MKSQNENKTNLLSVKFNLNNSRPKTILLLNVRHEDIHIEKIKNGKGNVIVVVKITKKPKDNVMKRGI